MVHAALTSWLAAPWEDPTLRRAFLAVLLLGVAGGALGCWLVFYGLAYSAESLSHALLPGLVLAALAGLPLLVGAAGGILVAALAVALAGRAPEIGRDTAVAVVVTALFGLGVLLALSPDTPPRLGGLLFGDVLGLSGADLALAALAAVGCLGALWLLHGRLLVVGFDRAGARALGVRPTPVDVVLLVLLAGVLLVAVRALGNLLVVAVLIAPAAAARLVTRRMAPMVLLAAALAVLAGWAGLYLSFHAETAAGASIAAALVAAYVAVAGAAGLRRAAG
jgi:ABC-type Mn2+/Zn2+ transport system permease subunit